MKREFLEGLEVNGVKLSKDLVEQIMAENGKDIAAEQAKTAAKDTELTTARNTIKSLEEAAKKFEGTDPEQLKKDLADLQKKYDTDLAENKRSDFPYGHRFCELHSDFRLLHRSGNSDGYSAVRSSGRDW